MELILLVQYSTLIIGTMDETLNHNLTIIKQRTNAKKVLKKLTISFIAVQD
jgi:hypothetical protein